MRALSKCKSTLWILLLALLIVSAVVPQQAQAQGVYAEYLLSRGNSNYEANMALVLERLGNGSNSWIIPARTIVSYNETAGDFTNATGYYTVYGIPGAGACDVATWFFHVASEYSGGLLVASGHTSSGYSNLDHPKIPGVPLPAVTIWNPGKDLTITNNNDFDVIIRWDLAVTPGYVRFWVETSSGAALTLPTLPTLPGVTSPETPDVHVPEQPQGSTNPLQQWITSQITNATEQVTRVIVDEMVKRLMPWILAIIGILVAIFVILLIKRPEKAVKVVTWMARSGSLNKQAMKLGIKTGIEWWLFTTVICIYLFPQLQEILRDGLIYWLNTTTTVSNITIAVLILVFLLNWWMRSWFNAKSIIDKGGYYVVTKKKKGWFKWVAYIVISIVVIVTIVMSLGQPIAATGNLSPIFNLTPVGKVWSDEILRWSAVEGVDPNLTATVMQIESCGNQHAHAGEPDRDQGLFQLNPKYFTGNLQDPEENARQGVQYIASRLRASGGNVAAALAGYNGGPSALDWFLGKITRDRYIQRLVDAGWTQESAIEKASVVEHYVTLGTAVYNGALRNDPTALEPFLASGSMCRAAAEENGLSWPFPTPTATPTP